MDIQRIWVDFNWTGLSAVATAVYALLVWLTLRTMNDQRKDAVRPFVLIAGVPEYRPAYASNDDSTSLVVRIKNIGVGPAHSIAVELYVPELSPSKPYSQDPHPSALGVGGNAELQFKLPVSYPPLGPTGDHDETAEDDKRIPPDGGVLLNGRLTIRYVDIYGQEFTSVSKLHPPGGEPGKRIGEVPYELVRAGSGRKG